MILTKTDVANMALAEIGARRITDYTSDATVESRACHLHLDHVADTLLRRHQWNFATARVELVAASAPLFGEWDAAWTLPADLVRLIRITSGDVDNPLRSYAIEGRLLLTKTYTTLGIVYVTNAAPVAAWDSLFVDAVTYKLAATIAADVAQNPTLQAACLQKLESLALPAAQTADAREVLSGENFGPRQLASMSGLVNARFNGSGRPPYIPTV
ncbi:MAG: hypothetical protein WCK77_14140 [Verrucomicrobiota bacterium]